MSHARTAEELRQRIDDCIEQLDQQLVELRINLEALSSLLPVSQTILHDQIDAAFRSRERAVAELCKAHEQLGSSCRPWADRQEFVLQVAEVELSLRLLEQEEPRRRLLSDLAEALQKGQLTYLQSVRGHYESVRSAAVAELLDSVKTRPVPTLPHDGEGVITGGSWLRWIWQLNEVERSRLLDELHARLPKLVEFVEGVKPEKFVDHIPVQRAVRLEPTQPADVPEPEAPLDRDATGTVAETRLETSTVPHSESSPEAHVPVLDPTITPFFSANAAGSSELSAAVESHSAVEPHSDVEQSEFLEQPVPVSFQRSMPAQPLAIAEDAVPLAPIPSIDLPPFLSTLEAYAAVNWVEPGGTAAAKPWILHRDHFITDVTYQLKTTLALEDYFRAGIFAGALEKLGRQIGLSSSDIATCCALAISPNTPDAGIDSTRAARLKEFTDASGKVFDRGELRLLLCLEALRPCLDPVLSGGQIEALIDRAEFELTTLAESIRALLKLARQGTSALEELRAQLRVRSPQSSLEQLQSELRQQRKNLWETYKAKAYAAGGQLRIRHCLEAWTTWIKTLSPLAKMLFPVEQGGVPTINLTQSQEKLHALAVAATQIAESHQVWYDERKRFDREVRALLGVLQTTLDTASDLASKSSPQRISPIMRQIPLGHIDTISSAHANDSYEELARILFLRAVGKHPPNSGAMLDLPANGRIAEQRLLALGELADGVIQQAAALLATQGHPVPPLLDRQQLNEIIVSVHLPRLRQLALSLDQMACVTLGKRLRDLSLVAGQVVQNLPPLGPGVELLRLVPPWLEQVAEHSNRALSLLQPVESGPSGNKSAVFRALMARTQAEAKYPNPAAHLANLAQELPEKRAKTQKDLLNAWLRGLSKEAGRRDQIIKTAFCTWAFDTSFNDGTLYKAGRNDTKEFVLLTAEIIRWLSKAEHNPSFVPQLRQHNSVVILTMVFAAEHPGVLQTVWHRAAQFPSSIVIVLCPGLGAAKRREIVEYAGSRDVTLAVLDDVDLLRLMNPEGSRPDSVLGLLEIALEQRPVRRVNPFSAQDGQHVAIEMFVGRREEARDLALTPKYSRLFSGRKLGKSALLRYVSETFDEQRLPSANLLRILYVSAVGVRYEQDMVWKILRQMESKLQYVLDPSQAIMGEAPRSDGDKLSLAILTYLDQHPGESLLIFLDEADVFVEEQIRQYSRVRETCLSFRMRSEIMAQTDNQGLPRVRFVFAGYRVTQLSQGAWANWGQVLRLGPLNAQDAAQLIGGPLGRLGVDAASFVDEIAFRCGYQPAVLHHVGQLLVEQLADRQPLTLELVSDVFHLPRIQEEIHSVVWNNFESNPAAHVVFAALCFALNDRPPAEGVLNACNAIIQRLLTFDSDLTWLGSSEDVQQSRIQMFLDEFVNREIIVGDSTSGCYRLRFPHHLSAILARKDEIMQRVRARIHEARRGEQEPLSEVPGLLSAERADQLAVLLGKPAPEFMDPAVFAGWHWPEALGDPSGGLVAQLGFAGKQVLRADEIDWRVSDQWLATDPLLILNAHPNLVKETLDRRERTRAPILFCGGADLLRWALQRDARPGHSYEFVELGRLTQRELRWWFSRRRGLEFHSDEAWALLWRLTGGIPILVREIDELLRMPDSPSDLTVSAGRLTIVESEFQRRLPSVAKLLVSGPRALQLAPRERQLLGLITQMSTAFLHRDFSWEEFQEYSPLIIEKQSASVEPPSPLDRIALQTLQLLGLIPAHPTRSSFNPFNRLVAIPAADAIFPLVQQMFKQQLGEA